MTILPGSLDYLYHNGILDRIPYEAYEIPPMTPSGQMQMAGINGVAQVGYGMNQYGNPYANLNMPVNTQMLNLPQMNMLEKHNTQALHNLAAKQAYSSKRPEWNTHSGYAPYPNDRISRLTSVDATQTKKEKRSMWSSAKNYVSTTVNTFINAPMWVKGLASAGVILTTVLCLAKGKKPAIKK